MKKEKRKIPKLGDSRPSLLSPNLLFWPGWLLHFYARIKRLGGFKAWWEAEKEERRIRKVLKATTQCIYCSAPLTSKSTTKFDNQSKYGPFCISCFLAKPGQWMKTVIDLKSESEWTNSIIEYWNFLFAPIPSYVNNDDYLFKKIGPFIHQQTEVHLCDTPKGLAIINSSWKNNDWSLKELIPWNDITRAFVATTQERKNTPIASALAALSGHTTLALVGAIGRQKEVKSLVIQFKRNGIDMEYDFVGDFVDETLNNIPIMKERWK